MGVSSPVPLADLEAQCQSMLEQLLPSGLAWPRPLGAEMQALVDAAAVELARVKDRARTFLREIDPRTTTELLAEWEALTGLPDLCETDPTPSSIERRFNLVARLTEGWGQSIAYYTAVGLALGYTITIEEHTRFEAGREGAGQQIGGADWIWHWTVHAPKFTPTFFTVGESGVGEALASWGDERLECFFQRIKPAHTTVGFVYDLEVTGYAPWGTYVCPGFATMRVRANQNHTASH